MFTDFFQTPDPLGITEILIEKYHPFPQITDRELESMLDSPRLLLFDVRQPEEYEVSHIRNSVLLPPDTTEAQFLQRYEEHIAGTLLVFYCSVGQRSSEMLGRLDDLCRKHGAVSCSNLKGGIFRWYNNGRPVVDINSTTDRIHEFNAVWGMMLRKR
ncbi:rhodanese-like domain-containing protein [Prosthecochloris sp. HL-130-GSB]|jgi:rhodanese-related sulfurtransferase|uniref:rhodanese-like domain-containing protein n=1 Tax=Prosthecochloris sp. HL-130-GSB TaxID=1974213 RepID=UPI000A1C13A5|nr:rhodanese-like domain-containing protein [Prosthecochloris sp. HL-130-GSB]ARM31493.1 hypothetical protein B9H02_09545 [Prosthecochloris sp. HL-130-GSB]